MSKPIPDPQDELHAQFWENCAKEKLCFQRCTGCKLWRHLPRAMCPGCGSPSWEWAESRGLGRIFSWTVTHRAALPFKDEAPFAVVIVELEEGVRMVSRTVDLEPADLALDLPVEVVFERVSEEMALPFFRPRR